MQFENTARATLHKSSDLNNLLNQIDVHANKVAVTYGAHTQSFNNLAGTTVGQVKKSLKDAFNMPEDVEAIVEGKQVNDDFVLEHGNSLEFYKTAGVKGYFNF
jgi:hypothetical protein